MEEETKIPASARDDKRGTRNKVYRGRVNATRRYDGRGTELTCSGHGYE
jgi:hypothetical protein